jgi:hypothetical protein
MKLNPDFKSIGGPSWNNSTRTPFHQDLRDQRYRVQTTAVASCTVMQRALTL